MPYFKMRLTANADDLADLRALPERARRIFKTHLQTDFKSWMQDQIDTLFAQANMRPILVVQPCGV